MLNCFISLIQLELKYNNIDMKNVHVFNNIR